MIRVVLSALCVCAAVASAPAGPVTPPAGPVVDSMRTLEQIEPRTPLTPIPRDPDPTDTGSGGQRAPALVITTPGSYFLTANVSVAAGDNGIEIRSSNVTLDLRGFSIIGLPGSLDGVNVPLAGLVNIKVYNGNIRGMGGDGLDLFNAFGSSIEDIRAGNCTGDGFRLGGGNIINCVARRCSSDGFEAAINVVFKDCNAELNTRHGFTAGNNCVLVNCNSSANGAYGVFLNDAAVLQNVVAAGNGTVTTAQGAIAVGRGATIVSCVAISTINQGFGFTAVGNSTFADCTARTNASAGFRLGPQCTLHNCTSTGNGAQGFTFVASSGTMTACYAQANTGDGINCVGSMRLIACTADANSSVGIRAGFNSYVANCLAQSNVGTGITAGDSIVIANQASNNSNAGIHINLGDSSRVEGNNTRGNTVVGIRVDGTGNLVISNAAESYNIASGNHSARIAANPGDAFTITEPFVNFQR